MKEYNNNNIPVYFHEAGSREGKVYAYRNTTLELERLFLIDSRIKKQKTIKSSIEKELKKIKTITEIY